MPWQELAWLESYDQTRIPESIRMWNAVGIDHQDQENLKVLDLACGCSITSFVLAISNPKAHITCVDYPDVLDVARDLASRLDIVSQVTFSPGDLHQIELEESQYNLVLLGNVTNFFTPDQNIDLFKRIRASISPKGLLVINVQMQSEDQNEQITLHSFILWGMSGTQFFPFTCYHTWLKNAGFAEIEKISDLWISAKT